MTIFEAKSDVNHIDDHSFLASPSNVYIQINSHCECNTSDVELLIVVSISRLKRSGFSDQTLAKYETMLALDNLKSGLGSSRFGIIDPSSFM